jgi:hypothetical protein
MPEVDDMRSRKEEDHLTRGIAWIPEEKYRGPEDHRTKK